MDEGRLVSACHLYVAHNVEHAPQVRDIMEKEGKIEVTCEFCADTYCFEEEEILALMQQAA